MCDDEGFPDQNVVAMAESNQLDLFTSKQKIKDIAGMQWVEYRPIAPVQDGCCMDFQVPATSQHYIDLDHSLLKLKVKVSKADGSVVAEDDKVGLTNDVLNSIFSQVDIILNDLNISPSVGNNHPYRAFLEVLLEDSGLRSTSQRLECEGYEQLNFTNGTDFSNDVIVLGSKVTAGKALSLIGKIRTDGCNLGKFIPNGVDIKIKLYQNTDAFRITAEAAGDYKLTVSDVILKVCQVKLSPEELVKQDEEFGKGLARFDYVRSDVRSFQIASGAYNANFENLYGGKIPLEVIAGLVSAAGYNGSTEKNPLKFANFNLNRIAVTVDGVSVPGPSLKPNFKEDKEDWCESFLSLFKEGDHTDVSTITYKSHHCLFRFDLEPYASEDAVPIQKSGNVRVSVGFSEALSEGVTLILYAKFADRFLIDRERNVFQDEAAAPYQRLGY